MSSTQLIKKLIARDTNIDSYKMRLGTLEDKDWEVIAKECSKLVELNFKIIDKVSSIQDVEVISRKLKNQGKLDVLFIDYLQLMRNKKRLSSREQEVADISRTLKLLTLELNIPIIALCQLNRNAVSSEPSLADLRESGSIEQDADNVLFLYMEEEQQGSIVDVTLKVAKQRNGAIGKVALKFNKVRNLFRGVTK
jgi:replicative DNA helicase